jgi:peptide subunit release factor RF-3
LTVSLSVAGDIIGLYDTGNYQIGDTLVGGKQKFNFQDLPQFVFYNIESHLLAQAVQFPYGNVFVS